MTLSTGALRELPPRLTAASLKAKAGMATFGVRYRSLRAPGAHLRVSASRNFCEPGECGASYAPEMASDCGRSLDPRKYPWRVATTTLRMTILFEEGDDGWIISSVPDGTHSQGRTRDEARANVMCA